MGNEHEKLEKENKKLKKMQLEANNNNKKIQKIISGNDENFEDDNEDNEIDEDKEKEMNEYDKEISRMLFDEEAELDEGERLKKNRKKRDKNAELKSYAEQIAEEQFMEEINRSKSVNRMPRRRGRDLSDDDDSDNDSYKGKRRTKIKKDKKKEKMGKKNNIQININDDDYEEDKNKAKRKTRKRNISNDRKQKNFNTEINKNLEEEDDEYEENEENGKNENNEDNLKINDELDKKNKKNKAKKKIFTKNTFDNIFGLGKKEKKEENITKEYNTYNPQNNVSPYYSFNPMQNGIPQMNYSPNIQQNYNPSMNPNQMGYNQMYPTQQNYNPSMNMTPMGTTPMGTTPMGTTPMGTTPIDMNSTPYQSMNSAPMSFFGKKSAISKKAYSKIKPEDLRIVLLYMKNSNNKYQEGLDLCGRRQYNDALTCFAQARSSYINLNKIMNGNPKAYPSEFRMVVSKKINEKLSLVYQSIKECSALVRTKNTEQILKNPGKAENILRSINNKNDFNFNNNNNFNNMNNNNIGNNNQNKQKNIHEKEEDEMDEKIESEIVAENPGVKFDDIIGMKEMKRILYEIIVVPTIRPDLFTGIRKPQRGILLFGPPGTGKTMIAKAIASECNSTFFNISASSLTSKWVGESEKTVKSLFKLAYKKAPSIIFIDEIDSILSKRSENENEATKRLKTEFLIQFDGLGSNNNARLLVIAATNRPMDLDEALLRRLPKRVYCGPLDEEGRFDFIKKVINRVETKLSDYDIQEVARMTNGYSNSDLKELCKEAAFQPVRELNMEQILKIKKFRPLVKKDLVKAVNKIRGTLSHKVINELLEWNRQFGGV